MNSFGDSLAAGLILSEQINYGNNRTSVGPKPKTAPKPVEMYKKTHQYPTAPMISAVITDSGIVGNPDVPDYQPTLYGGNMPPALIPLQMNEVGLEIACHINTAFITVQGMWKLHCLRSGRTCDCLLTIPMYEQEISKQLGRVSFSYDTEAGTWINSDFVCSYKVWSNIIWANLLTQVSAKLDSDKRGTFCLFVSPPDSQYVQEINGSFLGVMFLLAMYIGAIKSQMERMLSAASTPLLTNVSLVINGHPDEYEVYPFPIPDLFSGNPLIISGRFYEKFPDSIKVVGTLPDMTNLVFEVEAERTEQIPLNQAIKLSLSTGLPCEFTRMVSFETNKEKYSMLLQERQKGKRIDLQKYVSSKGATIAVVGGLVLGFGSVSATASNTPIGLKEEDLSQIIGSFNNALYCCDLSLLGDCCCTCAIAPVYWIPVVKLVHNYTFHSCVLVALSYAWRLVAAVVNDKYCNNFSTNT